MCSLNLENIPKGCHSHTFKNIFDYCVRNQCGVPIGIRKKIDVNDDADPSMPTNLAGKGPL